MARRRRGKAINGWLVVDKTGGPTSTQVVNQVRRLFDAQKAGHGGTLDPMATGLLPIALGEATKTVPYIMDGAKAYRFTVRWGQATDTDDAEGRVIEESPLRPDRAAIEAVLPRFQGLIEQIPPRYSAVKIDGQRAYDLARAEADFELRARQIWIARIALLAQDDADHATFEVDCGKGSYMRALARDIAVSLGGLGHVSALRRIRVGPFTEADSISLESLEALGHSAAALERLLPVESALDDIPALDLTESEANSLRNGQPVTLLARAHRERIRDLSSGAVVCAMSAGRAVALTRFEEGGLRPVRILKH